MSDNGDKKPDLVVPDITILSIDDARAELEHKKTGRTTGSASDFVTRRELVKVVDKIGVGIADAAYAMGQKVFDQVTDETSEMLREQEHVLRQELQALRLDLEAVRVRLDVHG